MTTLEEAEKEYCQTRCGEFACGWALTGNGKPCDLLMEFSRDFMGVD